MLLTISTVVALATGPLPATGRLAPPVDHAHEVQQTRAPAPVVAGARSGIVTPLAQVNDRLNVPKQVMRLKKLPASAGRDPVGAFRFVCGAGQLSYDDPLVYPGKKGAAHLHQFFGNLSANYASTYESLRASGASTCQNELNRSAYWIPALLTGNGYVVRPKYVAVYYKRRPASDRWFPSNKNIPARIPRGLSYIFGWDYTRPNQQQPNHTTFACTTSGKTRSGSMSAVLRGCSAGSRFTANIKGPGCWDGKNLTAKDQRSHLSYSIRNRQTGQSSCPSSHRYVLPGFTMIIAYEIGRGDQPQNWTFASDHMVPAKFRAPGYSFHADWMGAWNDATLETWQANCIDKHLNCSDGVLGNGTKMLINDETTSARNGPRLVRVPPRP